VTDLDALTLTLFGEARGEPIEGKIGVANVMRNRYLTHYRNANTYVDVCTAHAQFSAWTEEDEVMRDAAKRLATAPDSMLKLCREIAAATIAGKLADNSNGSNHYFAISMPRPPDWAFGKPPLAILGHHWFYNVA
jgi:spore germination cell wall hydrolase CwlJ-like protein